MDRWSSSVVLLATFTLQLVTAEFCQTETASWQCTCGCCDDYNYCCVSCGSYWYAWLLMTLFFLVCLCACLGCGSYGYRRYRRPLPTSYDVIHTSPGYGSATRVAGGGYKPATTNYQSPATMTTDNRAPLGYHGYPPTQPSDVPPPYNPNQAPPPYSVH